MYHLTLIQPCRGHHNTFNYTCCLVFEKKSKTDEKPVSDKTQMTFNLWYDDVNFCLALQQQRAFFAYSLFLTIYRLTTTTRKEYAKHVIKNHFGKSPPTSFYSLQHPCKKEFLEFYKTDKNACTARPGPAD